MAQERGIQVTSTFTFDPDVAGDDPRISFHDLRVVDDAGGHHLEGVVYIGELLTAFPEADENYSEAGIAPVLNIRPEHTLVSRKRDGTTVLREGTMEVKPGKQRQKVERWTRQLINESLPAEQRDPEARHAAVLGNLSIRLHPKYIESGAAVLTDRDGDLLSLADLEHVQVADLELHKDAQFDTAVDSLSRLKAAFKAERAMPGCLARRRTSVRVWIVDDDQAAAVAHAFNQEGDPVNATAAKYRHQDSPPQQLARALVDRSPHLGVRNIEILSNSVSKNSPKLTSFNTISIAIEQGWLHTPFDADEAEMKAQTQWLVEAWDALVKVRPEFGRTDLRQRQQWRHESIAGTAVSIHGVVAVLSAIYPSTDFSVLSKLKVRVPLPDPPGQPTLDGQPRFCDFFSTENPVWQAEGIVMQGKNGLLTRMSFQTRKAMASILRKQLGL
jgi:hypothetical protein